MLGHGSRTKNASRRSSGCGSVNCEWRCNFRLAAHPVAPLGVYGQSKEAGDRAVREALASHVILRTAWVYSPHGHNFVKTMLRLADERPVLRVVADQTGSPTSAADVAVAIATIVQQLAAGSRRWGTYHFTAAGAVTWHGFAEAIFVEAAPWRGPPPPVEAIATADYPLMLQSLRVG